MISSSKKYLSLREVGRILEIPPATVVYYRDRFSKFIPSEANRNGRLVYPRKSLEIFKAIRRCYREKLDRDQIETILKSRFPRVRKHQYTYQNPGNQVMGYGWPDPQTVDHLCFSMDKLASALSRQEEMLGQLRHMGKELKRLKEENRQAGEAHNLAFSRLEKELAQLKMRQSTSCHKETGDFRLHRDELDKDIVRQPMTIHYPPDRYLGLLDHSGQPLNIDQMIQTIRENAFGPRVAIFEWRRSRDSWTLSACLKTPGGRDHKTIHIEVRPTSTPKGNPVTEVLDMRVAGRRLSKQELLKFFKLFKTSMSGFEDPNSI